MNWLRFVLPTMGGKQVWGDEFLFAGARIQQNVLTEHYRFLDDSDRRLATGSWKTCYDAFLKWRADTDAKPSSDHLVLLLHGVFRSKDSFVPMARALRAAGYDAQAINYPSTRQSLQDHADQVERLLSRQEGSTTVSLVTHSMGGIVARVLLSGVRSWQQRLTLHRLVTIGTPHRGATAAHLLGRLPGFDNIAGPATRQLATDLDEIPFPDCKFGTIAGGRGDGKGYNPLIKGDDDFTVAVSSAILEEAEDHIVLPALHTFIMSNPEVIRCTARYLKTGRFRAL